MNIDSVVNSIALKLTNDYNIFKNIKSIIVCGNGITGYNTTSSAKFIDSHDIVVRINNFLTISHITGEKTNVLFAGSARFQHLEYDQIYPEISKFPIIISTEDVLNKIFNIKNITYNSTILLYDKQLIDLATKNLGYKTNYGISGVHCSLLFLAIAKIFNINISFLGFDVDGKQTDKEIYYYGERKVYREHYRHDWAFHSRFFTTIYNQK